MTYRPEIDGLRAVSVLGVVLFHARFGLTGGYVGVDVFFVISGYLITGLILKELATGEFSLANFWERRVRRILPALTVALAAVLALGLVVLLPRDLISLAMSSLAQLALVANVYFWRDTGYFAGAADMKPLLHVWSLAVEEQFYILYPLALVWLQRRGGAWMTGGLLAIGAVSLAASIYGTYYHPAAAFYLLPTRAWELLTGGVLACLPTREAARPWLREAAAWLGLAAIAAAMMLFDERTFFPGLAATLPVGGTALFIWANTPHRTSSGKLLATRPFVLIGLASYSWYLWHWPALVYLHYVGGANFENVPLRVAAVLASLLLALLSWRFVEQGFRRRRYAPTRRQLATVATTSLTVLLTACLLILAQAGFPARFPSHIRQLEREQANATYPDPSETDIRDDHVPVLGAAGVRPTCLLWGDSHAIVVRKLVDDLSRELGIATYSVAREAAPLVTGDSASRNEAILEFIARHDLRTVLLVARWSSVYDDMLQQRPYLISEAEREYRRTALRSLLERLQREGRSVWIMLEVPCQPGGDAYQAQAILSQAWPSLCRLERTSRAQHLAATANSRTVIQQAAAGLAQVLDPLTTCFDEQGLSIVIQEGHVCYLDDDHLTDSGARLLLEPLVRAALTGAGIAKGLDESAAGRQEIGN